MALILSSLGSTSKKARLPHGSIHPSITAGDQQVRFAATWRKELFKAPFGL
jgi:hypothetical protein